MRQVLVEEFGYEDLPTLLRQMADWLEQEEPKPKVWTFEFYRDEDYDKDKKEWDKKEWAGSIFCFPPPPQTPEN